MRVRACQSTHKHRISDGSTKITAFLACHRLPPQDASGQAARQPVRSDGSSGTVPPPAGPTRQKAPRSGSLGGRCTPASRCWLVVGAAAVAVRYRYTFVRRNTEQSDRHADQTSASGVASAVNGVWVPFGASPQRLSTMLSTMRTYR